MAWQVKGVEPRHHLLLSRHYGSVKLKTTHRCAPGVEMRSAVSFARSKSGAEDDGPMAQRARLHKPSCRIPHNCYESWGSHGAAAFGQNDLACVSHEIPSPEREAHLTRCRCGFRRNEALAQRGSARNGCRVPCEWRGAHTYGRDETRTCEPTPPRVHSAFYTCALASPPPKAQHTHRRRHPPLRLATLLGDCAPHAQGPYGRLQHHPRAKRHHSPPKVSAFAPERQRRQHPSLSPPPQHKL
eukprot:6198576-Pleurochrysis_carterae.AAC.1